MGKNSKNMGAIIMTLSIINLFAILFGLIFIMRKEGSSDDNQNTEVEDDENKKVKVTSDKGNDNKSGVFDDSKTKDIFNKN